MKQGNLPSRCYNSGEPYEKYMEISMTRNSQLILDIGTYKGYSAYSFAINKTNVVKTFDIADLVEIELPDNVWFYKKSCMDIEKDLLDKADVILLDVDPHDGVQEKAFFEMLLKTKFKGLLIVDDINLFDEMRAWWDSITLYKEEADWHHSGTGLISFLVQ